MKAGMPFIQRFLLFNFQGSLRVPWEHGGVAQMGEHLPCKQGVKGSNPFISTRPEGQRGKGMDGPN